MITVLFDMICGNLNFGTLKNILPLKHHLLSRNMRKISICIDLAAMKRTCHIQTRKWFLRKTLQKPDPFP